VKPVAGVLDLTSKTLEGIRNTATAFDVRRERVRVPRGFGADGELRAYQAGQELLGYIQSGAYRADRFVAAAKADDGRVALVSSRRVALADAGGRCLWQVPLPEIGNVSVAASLEVRLIMTPAGRTSQSGLQSRVVRCVAADAAAKLVEDIRRAQQEY
jgi:hypothetical protein